MRKFVTRYHAQDKGVCSTIQTIYIYTVSVLQGGTCGSTCCKAPDHDSSNSASRCLYLHIFLTLLQLLCEGLDIQPSLAHFQVSGSKLHAQLLHSLLLLLLHLLVAVQGGLVARLQGLVLVMVQLLELALYAVTLSLQLQADKLAVDLAD